MRFLMINDHLYVIDFTKRFIIELNGKMVVLESKNIYQLLLTDSMFAGGLYQLVEELVLG